MSTLTPPKPFKTYAELVEILAHKGLNIADQTRAERKLAQVGYYRLSGFWYPCRQPLNASLQPGRASEFMEGVSFDAIFDLYLFDKHLRLLMLDAIERIEIHIRSVIAHEMGFHDPLAYQNSRFINSYHTRNFTDARGRERNIWSDWLIRQNEQVSRSREDCIEWHRQQHKAMPFWVVVEAWDFGTISKYYEMLAGKYQNRIAKRLGVSNAKTLETWLREINTLRNRGAHHTRIWNQHSNNPLPFLTEPYFANLGLNIQARSRLIGLIAVIWYLVRNIGPNSEWIHQVADVIDSKPQLPGCPFAAMGLPDDSGFPREFFGI